jgi:hypothetical protein
MTPSSDSDQETDVGEQIRSSAGTIANRIAAFRMLDESFREATLAQKTARLSLCGFTNREISEMLQITTAGVAQNLYSERKKAGRPGAGKGRKQRAANS